MNCQDLAYQQLIYLRRHRSPPTLQLELPQNRGSLVLQPAHLSWKTSTSAERPLLRTLAPFLRLSQSHGTWPLQSGDLRSFVVSTTHRCSYFSYAHISFISNSRLCIGISASWIPDRGEYTPCP